MSRNIIEEMNRTSLVAVYLLPLLKLNVDTFGLNNYVDCKITHDGRFIAVEVRDLEFVEDPYHSPHYATTFMYLGRKFIAFRLGLEWRHTFEMFRDGKYSKFTEKAKQTIITYCGLQWKALTEEDKIVTDARLLALYRSDVLRDLMEDQLDVKLDPEDELQAPPKPELFLNIPELDNLLRHNAYPSL